MHSRVYLAAYATTKTQQVRSFITLSTSRPRPWFAKARPLSCSTLRTWAIVSSPGFGNSHTVKAQTAGRNYHSEKNRPLPQVLSRRTTWVIAGCAIVFFVYNLDRVPGTDRLRFNCCPYRFEQWTALLTYEWILKKDKQHIVSSNHRMTRELTAIMNKILVDMNIYDDREPWELTLIQTSEINAAAFANNKIVVYSGILDSLHNRDTIAAVLGHEIAHVRAHHHGERISWMIPWLLPALPVYLLASLIGLRHVVESWFLLGVGLPGSRAQELEADYLGLMMMAQSGFRPTEALNYWHSMYQRDQQIVEAARRRGIEREHLDLMLTHPMGDEKAQQIEKWLPKAMEIYEKAKPAQR